MLKKSKYHRGVKYLADFKNILKYLFLYHEPDIQEEFILKEKESGKAGKEKTSERRKEISEDKQKTDNKAKHPKNHESKLISKNLTDNIEYLKRCIPFLQTEI